MKVLEQSKTDPSPKKTNLASLLGIYYNPASNSYDTNLFDPFSQLFLNPNAIPSSQVTEFNLEVLFGLVDSTRNPLSDGPISGTGSSQITRWNLSDVNWNKNTSIDGKIYLTLARTGSSGAYTYTINLYSDSGLTNKVGAGNNTTALGFSGSGKIVIAEYNESGLSGVIQIVYASDISTAVVLQTIPLFTCWRLRELRYEWYQNEYIFRNQQNLLIDPDLLNPADFFITYPSIFYPSTGYPLIPINIFLERSSIISSFKTSLANSTNSISVTLPTGTSLTGGSLALDANRNLIYIDKGTDGSFTTPDIKYIPYSSSGYSGTPKELIPYSSATHSPGYVNNPVSIYVDSNNELFIADYNNDVIHHYSLTNIPGASAPLTATFLKLLYAYSAGLPVAISSDGNKNIYAQFAHNGVDVINLPDILSNSNFNTLRNLIVDAKL